VSVIHPRGRPVRLLALALRQTRHCGTEIRRRTGKPSALQAAEQVWLALRFGLSSKDYYQYRLYLRENRRRAGAFLHQERILELLAALHPEQAYPQIWDKRDFFEACARRGLPAIPVLLSFSGGQTDPQEPPADLGAGDLCSKPARGFYGSEVKLWRRRTDGRYESDSGALRTTAELLDAFRQASRNQPYVLQPRISNHPALARFSSGALCTVRMHTGRRRDGTIESYLPVLKMPAGTTTVDNFHAGNLAAPVEMKSGRLGFGLHRDRWGMVTGVERHPDTGARIAGFELPHWSALQSLARRAQAELTDAPLAAFDIAITREGPVLVEGNLLFGAEIGQVVHDTPIGESPFAAIYEEYSQWQAGKV